MLSKIEYGNKIIQVVKNSIKQSQILTSLNIIKHFDDDNIINTIDNNIKDNIKLLHEIDYTLDDLCLILFYEHKGNTLYSYFYNAIKSDELNPTLKKILFSETMFKSFIFQYLFATLQLHKNGIIQNDPHINNILIYDHDISENIKFDINFKDIIEINLHNIGLSIIDFNNAILSPYHIGEYTDIYNQINEELGIVYDKTKENIIKNNYQIFSCYAVYDVIRFVLILKKVLIDLPDHIISKINKNNIKKYIDFLHSIYILADSILIEIYNPTPKLPFDFNKKLYGGVEHIILKMFKPYYKLNKSHTSEENIASFIKLSFDDTSMFVNSDKKTAIDNKNKFISRYINNNL
jgi:hypothetical protein